MQYVSFSITRLLSYCATEKHTKRQFFSNLISRQIFNQSIVELYYQATYILAFGD
jgi:hypothetical protein